MDVTSNNARFSKFFIILFGWSAFLWAPCQYFLRAANYLYAFTAFDTNFLLISLIVAVILAIGFQNRPLVAFLIGGIGVTIFAYISLFAMPIMDYSDRTYLITLCGDYQTQAGFIPMCLLIATALLGFSGLVQLHTYSWGFIPEGGKREFNFSFNNILAFGLSPLFYYGISLLFPTSTNNPLLIICLFGSFQTLIVGIEFKQLNIDWRYPNIGKIQRMHSLEHKTPFVRGFALIIAWVAFTMIELMVMILYFYLNRGPQDVILMQNFMLSCGIGGLLLIVLMRLGKASQFITYLLPIIAASFIFIQTSIWMNGGSFPLVNILFGCAIVFNLWSFFFLITKFSKGNGLGVRGFGTFPLFFSCLIGSYIANLAVSGSELQIITGLLPVLVLLGGLFTLVALLLYFFVPTLQKTIEMETHKDTEVNI